MEFFAKWLMAGVIVIVALMLVDDLQDRIARRRERQREDRRV